MKLKRIISVVLCVMMLVSLCACKDSKKSQLDMGEKSLTHKITEEPLELTLFAKYIDEAQEESVFVEAYDKTNILLTPTLSENVTDMDQALALAVAAKNIPDVIYDWKQENFNKYGMQGALIPLNDLIDKYAPNYKKFLDENPDIKYFATASDGNMYFIPAIADGEASTGWFIRQDWLDKLGLEVPNTLEEFYNVMVAFRDNDPNGNGQKDEVPYFGAQADVATLLSLFNAHEEFRYKDGKVTYGPMEDEFLVAVKEIGKWYQEGLIDVEFFTRTDARDYLTANNTGGITHNWFGSTSKINDTLKDSVPGFSLLPFAPPAGVDGVRREINRRARTNGEGWAISSMNKHPEETIKYFDFWFTEEGRLLSNFGVEGIYYDMVDGEPIFKESALNGDPQLSVRMLKARAMINFGSWQNYAAEAQWTNEISRQGVAMYQEGGYLPALIERPALSYFEGEKRHSVLSTQLETYVDENVQHWILGTRDPDADFETFKDTLKTLGVEEYISIEQSAYDKYLEIMEK